MPRTLETTINRDQIVSQVAAWLHAARLINDNEDITDITFGDLSQTQVPIKIHFNQPKVTVINH